jgi:hypothetical protein
MMARAKSGLWERDVEGLLRSRYDIEGAGGEFARMVFPVSRDSGLSRLKTLMKNGTGQTIAKPTEN